MRVDEKTKEVFFCINLFPSQDFGDYSESRYSALTTEGKAISRLIRGYTDAITQKGGSKPEVEEHITTRYTIPYCCYC